MIRLPSQYFTVQEVQLIAECIGNAAFATCSTLEDEMFIDNFLLQLEMAIAEGEEDAETPD